MHRKMIMKILTSPNDDFLYDRILKLLKEIKLVRGGTDLAYTLRNHKVIRDYLKEKQVKQIEHIENTYFVDGSLNTLAIDNFLNKKPLQN